VLFDEVRAGGRINLIIGRWPDRQGARVPGPARLHAVPPAAVPAATKAGFTLAQKMVGRACGLPEGQGVRPGTYCEAKMTTVGSRTPPAR
jgi:aconitate hydratase 2/2-methylisocitrate dehydratase